MTARHHHPVSSLNLFVDLAGRFARAASAIAAAVAIVLLAAGWIEGHPPDGQRLGTIALPFAATLGAGWVLARWHAGGEHIAMANLGLPPSLAAGVLLLSSAPLMAAATALRVPPPAADALEVREGAIIARLGGVESRWTWRGEQVTRATAGQPVARYGPMRRPTAITAAPRDGRSGWLEFAARLASLTLLLMWLIRRADRVDPAVLCVASAVAFGAGHLAGRL